MDKLLTVLIPLTAIILSALGLLASTLASRNTTKVGEFERLCGRVKELEDELKASQEREKALMRENLELLRQVAGTARCPLADCPVRLVTIGGHPQ